MNLSYNHPPRLYFLFHKESCSSFEDTRFHGPTLNGAGFVSTSEVPASAILEWMKLRD
jgi:hypothetical protein